MNKITKWAGMLTLILILGSGAMAPRLNAQPGVSVSINAFYDELRPHGTWMQDPVYGQVWQPRAERGFRPYYTRGRWVMTDAGNTWTSDYDWGWAPFHYGRWVQRRRIGWVWIPGTEWAPAWVSWRTGGDDYGWAPLTPEINLSLTVGGGSVNAMYNSDYYYNGNAGNYDYGYNAYQDVIPVDYWVFVPRVQIFSPSFYRYDRGPRYNTTIIHNTTIINNVNVYNNVRYSYGPRPDDIRRFTGRPVPVYHLQNNNRPGRTVIQKNVVNIYRPTVNITNNNRFVNNRFIDNRVNPNRNAHNAVLDRTANQRPGADKRNPINRNPANPSVANPAVRPSVADRRQQIQAERAQRQQTRQNQAPNAVNHPNVVNRKNEQVKTDRPQQPNVANPRAEAVQQQKQQAQKAAEMRAAEQQKRQEAQAHRAAQQNNPVKAEHQPAAPQRNEAAQAQRQQAQEQKAAQHEAARQEAQQQRAAQRNEVRQQQPPRAPQANPQATRPAPPERAAQREAAQQQKRQAERDAHRQEQNKK